MRHAVLAAVLLALGAGQAFAQVSARTRAQKFWETFTRGEASSKELAFDVLTPADDPVVIKMSFRALRKPHPLTLAAAVEFLKGTTGEKALAYLEKEGLGNRDDLVRYACCAALADPAAPKAPLEAVIGLLEDRDWLVRAAAVQALSDRKVASSAEKIAVLVDDDDPRVRVAVQLALEAFDDPAHGAAVTRGIGDACWQVRSAAIDAAKTVRPRCAVGALIDRYENEEGRLRLEAYNVLVDISGKDYGKDIEAWRRWWEGKEKREGTEGRLERESSRYVVEAKKPESRKFFGVPTDSKRVIFVLDLSSSMDNFAKPFAPRREYRPGEHPTRFSILLDELKFCLESFEDDDFFNVVVFNTRVYRWKDSLVSATASAKHDAVSFIRGKTPDGETNLFDAFAEALGVDDRNLDGGRDYVDEIYGVSPRGAFEAGPETIFLLSDGVPNKGSIQDAEKIVDEITRVNRLRRIVIHAIAVGIFPAQFLHRMARENGGTYMKVGE